MPATHTPPLAKLLIVDDEAAQMTALCNTLEDEGYATFGFTAARDALAALREQEFDLVLTDLQMPGIDGIALLSACQEIDRNVVGIVMTGHGAIDTAVQAMQAGALDYLQKPFKLREVLPVLKRALTVRRLRTENIQLRQAAAIRELSNEFTKEHKLQTVIAKITEAAFRESNGGEVAVLMPLNEQQALSVVEARGGNAENIKGVTIPLDDRFQEWLYHVRTTLSSSNDWSAEQFHFDYQVADLNHATSMPMIAAGELLGVLNFTLGPPARSITVGQLKALSILAGSAAAAMEVASLVGRLQGANDELEERVEQRTAQLAMANRELEAFSYTVSHDLRAPLRTVIGYADMLLEDVPPSPADMQHSLNGIRIASRRMSELINDLLELCHAGRQALLLKQIQPRELVQQVLSDLQQEHHERQVTIELQNLPECIGDESLLRQVFVNLLSNAYKFTAKCAQAKIEIGAHEQNDELIYFVRDNGAGFDMSQVNKLFGVFERLHTATDFEGTGIGLSIVQRIVNRHGGRAWAEGRVGHGAAFYFSLPSIAIALARAQAQVL